MNTNSDQTSPKRLNQNFEISEEEFVAMLENLSNGDETLFEQIFLAHVEDCISFLQKKYQVSRAEAYDATLDTLLVFRKRLLDGKISYGNMRFLFTQMAGQVLMKSKKKHQTNPIESIPELAEEILDNSNYQTLDKAWELLGEDCSNLLTAFYYKKQQLKDIAERLGKTEVALRKQKQRCLEKLRTNFVSVTKKLNS